jgi:predicted nucleic acid-binding protein
VAGITLDTSALMAIGRGDRRMQALLDEATAAGAEVVVPAGVIGQAWRGSGRQARFARLLALPVVRVVPLDDAQARTAGALCGLTATADVIDASVVICARARGHAVITSDPDDMARLDPSLRLIAL